MTSRERVMMAVNHREPDKVPVDLGGRQDTAIAAGTLYRLREALGLPKQRVKLYEPFQMLGLVTDDVREALGVDTVPLEGTGTIFGYELKDWKEWDWPDGTETLVPGGFNTCPEPDGTIYQYPQGDKSALPTGQMPPGGFYFDAIIRQGPIEDSRLDPRENLEEFRPMSEEALAYFAAEAERLDKTDYAVLATFGGTALGDTGLAGALMLKQPRGIRSAEEWYISLITRKDYAHAVFRGIVENGIGNLEKCAARVGDRAQIVALSGADYGTQRGPLFSVGIYRELFKPYHKTVNDWVHRNTSWKTWMHSCGGLEPLIPEFIEAGFDILNPVQCSADGMDPVHLKREYGRDIVFWGGGVNTQKTLPFGTPEDVRREVLARLEVFSPGGGYVFNPVHNIQPQTPVENVLAMFDAVREFNGDASAG